MNENGEIHYWYFAAMLFYPYGDRGAMYCAFGEHGADVALRRSALAYGGRFPSRWADIPLLNVFTWIRPLRLADEENHWEYRRLPGYSEPKQGDIAVFNSPVDPQLLLVKRITRVVKKGEPLRIDRRTLLLYRSLILRDGGKVMEKDGKIYIDGKSSSQYIPKQRFYYMEGDNRIHSHDSRSFGLTIILQELRLEYT